jgi:hypothetical protein
MRLKVDFIEFATELDYDFLEIYNGSTTSSILVVYHGNKHLQVYPTVTDGNLTLGFTSDNVVADKG